MKRMDHGEYDRSYIFGFMRKLGLAENEHPVYADRT